LGENPWFSKEKNFKESPLGDKGPLGSEKKEILVKRLFEKKICHQYKKRDFMAEGGKLRREGNHQKKKSVERGNYTI